MTYCCVHSYAPLDLNNSVKFGKALFLMNYSGASGGICLSHTNTFKNDTLSPVENLKSIQQLILLMLYFLCENKLYLIFQMWKYDFLKLEIAIKTF